MNRIATIIRKLTIPPTFAVILLLTAYIAYPNEMGSVWYVLGGILCLAVLPAMAYPLQKYIPGFKDKGRNGQRTLAMIFSFIGYLLGAALAYILNAPNTVKIIALEYLFCGITMLICNKVFKFKASGHACGVIGPIFMMAYLGLYIPALVCTLFVIPVFAASIQTKQHTAPQLLGGSVISPVMLMAVHFISFCL